LGTVETARRRWKTPVYRLYQHPECIQAHPVIPSKKAEPFKQWLAKVGYERVQEIENPELAQERMKQLYEQKDYSQEWIEKRLRGIAIRQE